MSNRIAKLTRWLVWLLRWMAVVCVAAFVADAFECYSLTKLPPTLALAEDLVRPSEIPVAIVGVLQVLLQIALGIIFLMWTYRANATLREESPRELQFSPAGSIGWYFVPIANLFMPYRAMREILWISRGETPGNDRALHWWWGLWLVNNVLGQATLRATFKAKLVSEYLVATACGLFSDVVTFALCLVAVKIVREVMQAYEKNYVSTAM